MEEVLRFKWTMDHYCLFLVPKKDSYIYCKLTEEMETILLNHDFKMNFLLSKRLRYADGLSRLNSKLCEPLEQP